MPSPFPGMDPYLEASWGDVHLSLVSGIRDALQSQLPPDLRARSEQQVILETPEGDGPHYRPDTFIETRPLRVTRSTPRPASPAVIAASYDVDVPELPLTHRWVQILDTSNGNRVVTIIEVLSPSNKAPGSVNRAYLAKLADCAAAGVSVVEIDLVRSVGRGRLPVSQLDLAPELRTPYLAAIRRAWTPTTWSLIPIPLRQSLPVIPVPLRENESEAILALQPLIDYAHSAGRYDDLDYTQSLTPPLPPADADWLNSRLASR
jgi:hypothetical protein